MSFSSDVARDTSNVSHNPFSINTSFIKSGNVTFLNDRFAGYVTDEGNLWVKCLLPMVANTAYAVRSSLFLIKE